MQTTASAVTRQSTVGRRCFAVAAAPPSFSSSSSRRGGRRLTVRAFGPGSELQEGVEVGSRVKVTKSIKVYHVPKKPELDIQGREGVVSEVVRFHNGAELSATMPYKVVLDDDDEAVAAAAASGKKPLKVTVHLSGSEIERLEA